jgi:hypothetical protein
VGDSTGQELLMNSSSQMSNVSWPLHVIAGIQGDKKIIQLDGASFIENIQFHTRWRIIYLKYSISNESL